MSVFEITHSAAEFRMKNIKNSHFKHKRKLYKLFGAERVNDPICTLMGLGERWWVATNIQLVERTDCTLVSVADCTISVDN